MFTIHSGTEKGCGVRWLGGTPLHTPVTAHNSHHVVLGLGYVQRLRWVASVFHPEYEFINFPGIVRKEDFGWRSNGLMDGLENRQVSSRSLIYFSMPIMI